MSTIDATTSTTATPTSTSQSLSGLGADSDMFLKLLVENLRHQDPMQPTDSSEYMAQISQMTMVEQMTSLATTSKQTAHDQAIGKAVSLIGHAVTYLDADGNQQQGTVEKVGVSDDGPTLTIGGVAGIDPAAVIEVA